MQTLTIINEIHDFLWGVPLVMFIFFVGLYLTIKLKFIQVTKIKTAFRAIKSNNNDGITSFQAICMSLSATIGTGNIIGVASAITIGGPGALFWMILSSVLGLAIKYSEGFLAVKYKKLEDGRLIGGPYAYIEYGMGKKYKFLSKSFAIFGMLAAFLGLGTFIQMNGIVEATNNLFSNNNIYTVNIFNQEITIAAIIIALIITIISAFILIGGLKRIARVCEYLVPIMTIIYISTCLILIIYNIDQLTTSIKIIFQMAFTTKTILGGVVGYNIKDAILQGTSKGIFTSEAGLGSSPIAISTVDSNDPVKEGLASMGASLIGTFIICTLTGLCAVMTSSYQQGLVGLDIANYVFNKGLPLKPIISSFIILLCIISFAFTTIIGWNVYGVKCLDYLTKGNQHLIKIFQWIYILMIFIGSFLEVSLIWDLAEIFNALMAIPNLIAIVSLSSVIKKDTEDYLKNKKT